MIKIPKIKITCDRHETVEKVPFRSASHHILTAAVMLSFSFRTIVSAEHPEVFLSKPDGGNVLR